jgi:hypothetical protein
LASAPNAAAKTESAMSVTRKSLFSSRIFQAPAMARYIAEEIEPGAQCDNDDELLDFIRHALGRIPTPPSPHLFERFQCPVDAIYGPP